MCQWLIISKHFILCCLMICFESIPLCFWFQCNRFIKLELNVESKIQKVTDIIDWFTCKYLDSSSLYFNVCFFISNFSIITLTYLLFIACWNPRLIWQFKSNFSRSQTVFDGWNQPHWIFFKKLRKKNKF